jgi:hypothetical protein
MRNACGKIKGKHRLQITAVMCRIGKSGYTEHGKTCLNIRSDLIRSRFQNKMFYAFGNRFGGGGYIAGLHTLMLQFLITI